MMLSQDVENGAIVLDPLREPRQPGEGFRPGLQLVLLFGLRERFLDIFYAVALLESSVLAQVLPEIGLSGLICLLKPSP